MSRCLRVSVSRCHRVTRCHSHSTRSLLTSSRAAPTLASLTEPSFSLLALHFLILPAICSRASFPTFAPLSRTSKSHDFVDAVTASLMDSRREGRDERRWA